MNHLGTKTLQTERLTLRPFTVEDAPAMFENWANDPAVTRFLTWTPHESAEVTRALLTLWEEESKSPETYNWGIVFEGKLIGNVSLLKVNTLHERAALGYCMGRKWWGRGIMTEAVRTVLRYCFEEVGFYRITGEHAARNLGSGRVMEKCGLRYEGTLREYCVLHSGEREDIVIRGITRADYFSQK